MGLVSLWKQEPMHPQPPHALHELVCPPICSTKALTRCWYHTLGHPIFQSHEGHAISVIHNLPVMVICQSDRQQTAQSTIPLS